MRTYSQFLENLEQRRAALAQRKQEQMARIKQQNAQNVSNAQQVSDAGKEKLAASQSEIDAKKQEWEDKRKEAEAG